MFKIMSGDLVKVMKGRDRGKQGKVRSIHTKENRAVVADVNVMKKHVKPGTRSAARQAGIIDIEMPIQLANLALVCAECHEPTRVSIRVLTDGSKVRVCKKCGQAQPVRPGGRS